MLRLRLATMVDVDRIATLIGESVRALSAGHYTAREVESALRSVFGPDSQLVADGTYYLIEDDGKLAAAGGWSRRGTRYGGDQAKTHDHPHAEGDALLDPAHDAARIRAFFVHPAHARRGLGRTLYAACRDAARAAGFRRLELVATLPGEPLYRALGFTEIERFAVPLPDGESLAVVRMERALDDAG